MLRELLSRILGTFRRSRLDQDFDEELRAHLDLLTDRYIARGMDPGEAAYAARRQFGGITQMKEELRERRALPPIETLVRDVRYAVRQLWQSRNFSASAVATLAICIGAGSTVFAVVNAVILRPLPFEHPDRIMAFRGIDRRGTPHPTNLSYPNFFGFRAQNRVFDHLVSYHDSRFVLSDRLPAIQVNGEVVGWDLFTALGVKPELGPGFRREDEARGTHVVVVSHELWQSRFGGDRGVAGKQVRMNGKLFRVAGVGPPGFRFPVDGPVVQLWTTIAEDTESGLGGTPITEQRGARVLEAIGVLKAGVTPAQAQAQTNQIGAALAEQFPNQNRNVAATLVTPEIERLSGSSRKPLWMLMAGVGLVLLIGCGNVANLLLARSIERGRELALRTALGASRQALVRQLLTESLIVGFLGATGGILITALLLRFVLPLAGSDVRVPRILEAAVDFPVLAFSILATLITVVLFSLAPAIQVIRTDLTGVLKEGASGTVTEITASGVHWSLDRLRSAWFCWWGRNC